MSMFESPALIYVCEEIFTARKLQCLLHNCVHVQWQLRQIAHSTRFDSNSFESTTFCHRRDTLWAHGCRLHLTSGT